MLLYQEIITSSIGCCLFFGIVWYSLVYYITTNSIHYILSIIPLYQYFYMLHEAKKERTLFSPSYSVCSDFWYSGIKNAKSSRPHLKTHYTKLYQTIPIVSTDAVWFWYSVRGY